MKTYTIPPACIPSRIGANMHGIDPRHAQLLYNILLIPQIRTYLEIGCGYGVSTSAVVEAISRRPDEFYAEVCDTRITDVVKELRPATPLFLVHQHSGLDLLAANSHSIDCVFIDDDHSSDNVAAEIKELRRLDVPTIIAHDTNNPQYPGPRQFIDAYADYESIHDERFRGLFIASRDHVVMEQIRWAYTDFLEWYTRLGGLLGWT